MTGATDGAGFQVVRPAVGWYLAGLILLGCGWPSLTQGAVPTSASASRSAGASPSATTTLGSACRSGGPSRGTRVDGRRLCDLSRDRPVIERLPAGQRPMHFRPVWRWLRG